MFDRARVIFFFSQGAGEIRLESGRLGIESARLLVAGDRFIEVPLLLESLAEVPVNHGHSRSDLQCFPVACLRFFEVILGPQGVNPSGKFGASSTACLQYFSASSFSPFSSNDCPRLLNARGRVGASRTASR